jgi:hypothetical protein
VIVGRGIILAHVSPLPGNYSQLVKAKIDIPKLSRDHHDQFMAKIQELYKIHQAHFPAETTAWGIFSYGPEGSMKSVENQIRTSLKAMGHEMVTETYREMDATLVRPPKGEVVGCMKGDERLLFLESRLIHPKPLTATAQGASAIWKYEKNEYVAYVGPDVQARQKSAPQFVSILDTANQAVRFHNGTQLTSRKIGVAPPPGSGWILEQGRYKFLRDGTVANELTAAPKLVNILDKAQARVLFHNGINLLAYRLTPSTSDRLSTTSGQSVHQKVVEEQEDDDDDDDSDSDEDDEDDSPPATSSRANQPGSSSRQSNSATGSGPNQAGSSSRQSSSVRQWVRATDGYCLFENGRIAKTQTAPPLGVPYSWNGETCKFDGTSYYVSRDGKWLKMIIHGSG